MTKQPTDNVTYTKASQICPTSITKTNYPSVQCQSSLEVISIPNNNIVSAMAARASRPRPQARNYADFAI